MNNNALGKKNDFRDKYDEYLVNIRTIHESGCLGLLNCAYCIQNAMDELRFRNGGKTLIP